VALGLIVVLLGLRRQTARLLTAFVAMALLGHASTGLRATVFQQQALNPALEGQDISVTGYEERGIRVIGTPLCGAALWHSGQPQQIVCERERRPRYWQRRPLPAL
jgi:hypothetical protein